MLALRFSSIHVLEKFGKLIEDEEYHPKKQLTIE